MPAGIATPVTLGTQYADNGTLGPFQEVDEIIFQFTGGPVAFQFGSVDPSGAVRFDNQEIIYPPGAWAFRNIKGIRFRSITGQTAVTIQAAVAFFADDPEPFTPGNVPGSVSLTSTLNFQHNDVLVASEPTVDFQDGANLVWTITDDNVNSRVKVTASLTGIVTSFNGRSGAIVPASGDYIASEVTNAYDLSQSATQTGSGLLQLPGLHVNNVNFGGLGYSTGAGGTVTQTTSLSTPVTLNTYCGFITTFTSALAGNTVFRFTVNCNVVSNIDVVHVCWLGANWGPGIIIWVSAVNTGSFEISYFNTQGLTPSAHGIINFAIIKSATS